MAPVTIFLFTRFKLFLLTGRIDCALQSPHCHSLLSLHPCEITVGSNSGLAVSWRHPWQEPQGSSASLESVSGQQVVALLPLRRELPPASTHQLSIVALVVTPGADQAALLSSSISPFVTGSYVEAVNCYEHCFQSILNSSIYLWTWGLNCLGLVNLLSC